MEASSSWNNALLILIYFVLHGPGLICHPKPAGNVLDQDGRSSGRMAEAYESTGVQVGCLAGQKDRGMEQVTARKSNEIIAAAVE